MIKNGKKIKLAQNACKFDGTRGIFNKIRKKGTLPLNKRVVHPVKNTFCVLGIGIVMWVGANKIDAEIFNHQVPVGGDNFGPSDVFDNPQEIPKDDDGTIIVDDTTKEEMQVLKSSILSRFQKDASKRSPDNIESIDKILSLSLLPYNACPDDNEFDKFILSILFETKGQAYTLNYITGKEFSSEATADKEFLGDFSQYLTDECALDTSDCDKMTELRSQIAQKLGAKYVGESYVAYSESSDEFYYIPVFSDSSVSVYSVMCNIIDGQDLDPLETLLNQLSGNGEALFDEVEVSQNYEDLQKVFTKLQNTTYEKTVATRTKPQIPNSQRFKFDRQRAQMQYRNQMKNLPKQVSRPEIERY